MHSHCKKSFNTNVILCVHDGEIDFLWYFATKTAAPRSKYSLHVQFVWKARLVGFAFYYVVFSNDIIKMSFWFHFVGEKLVYRCCNFHDIILSALAVITNDMHPNNQRYGINQPYRDVIIKQSKNYFMKSLQLSSSFVWT